MADFHSLGTVGRQDQAGFESSAKFRTILPKTENSPQGNKLGLNTPFFQRENTENKYTCSGHSVKEFSLGKPQKFRSTYKKRDLFMKTEEVPASKDSVHNKENLQAFKYLGALKQIKDNYLRLIDGNLAEKAKFNQAEVAALTDDVTLFLNDDTRINNSFINESQQKNTHTGLSNTPSKTPTRYLARSRSATRNRRDDSMNNSQLMTSIDRPGEKTPTTSIYGGNNDSVFLKSHDFPRMLKRQKQRNYTKVLIPFLVAPEKQGKEVDEEGLILDLYQLQKNLKLENSVEHFEGLSLIRNTKKPVLIKRSKEQKSIMQEIVTQLVFYENEISFKANHFAKMKDFFNTSGLFYVIYEKPGDVLSSLSISNTLFTEKQVIKMAEDIATGLNCLHNLGLVHAKINSDSIYFNYEPQTGTYNLTLCDFDRCFFDSDPPTKIEADCCSAPEIVFNSTLVDQRADIWSLGCMVFYLLTGKHLFPTKSRGGLAYLMTGLELDSSSLFTLFPDASSAIDKLTEISKRNHEEILATLNKLISEIKQAKPSAYKLMTGCLKYNPAERGA